MGNVEPLMLSERVARLAGASAIEIELARTQPQLVPARWPVWQATWMIRSEVPTR